MSLWSYTDGFNKEMWDVMRRSAPGSADTKCGLTVPDELAAAFEEIGYANEQAAEVLRVASRYPDGEVVDWVDCSESFDLQGGIFVAPEHKCIFVNFRGSTSDTDWRQGWKMAQIDYDAPGAAGAKVHQGFLEQYRDTGCDKAQHLVAEVAELATTNPGFSLTIGGHSAGGAIATIFAAEVVQARSKLPEQTSVRLITLGSPRVGNAQFARWLEGHARLVALRVKNQADFYTRLPFLNYHHVGRLLWLRDGRARAYAEGSVPLASTWPDFRRLPDAGSDHELWSYMSSLAAWS